MVVMANSSRSISPDVLVVSGGRQLTRTARPERQASYDDEVRRLISAAQQVMLAKGRTEQPRVAEIVAAAGITNQAFYRHFRSRDDVIIATYEQGLLTISNYLAHRVKGRRGLTAKVTAWIDGILAQIEDSELTELSAAILWNVAQIARDQSEIEPKGHARILEVLTEVLRAGGVAHPDRTAHLVQTTVTGVTEHCMETDVRLSSDDRAALIRFCLAGITTELNSTTT
jgi:AcrR family transcriptional regulator